MNLLDLPGEILQRVFRTFTTVEVARASGTCHKLRAFTPQFIAAPSLPSLQWAVKRWHHAEVLQLSLHPDAEPIHALIQQNASSLSELQWLEVKHSLRQVSCKSCQYKNMCASCIEQKTCMDLAFRAITAEAQKLRYLVCEFPEGLAFPSVLTWLEHLVLRLPGSMAEVARVVQQLTSMQCLQSLTIQSADSVGCWPDMELPILDVSGLSLKVLNLDAVPFPSINIPSQCALHVSRDRKARLDQACAPFISSLCTYQAVAAGGHEQPVLPKCLLHARNLTRLVLDGFENEESHHFCYKAVKGDADHIKPLIVWPELANLQVLEISGLNVDLSIETP